MFNMIENYVYLYHLDKFVVIPTYPESISDSYSANFAASTPLLRSAPIFSYTSSGPRTMQISITLHRDMMTQINYGVSNLNVEIGDDYVDTIIKELQSIAVPKYSLDTKLVNPPMVAVRFGNDIYIKGVVNGAVGVTYSGPILESNKYALVKIDFTVSEVDPYDADSIVKYGSFRGLSKTLERRLFKS